MRTRSPLLVYTATIQNELGTIQVDPIFTASGYNYILFYIKGIQ